MGRKYDPTKHGIGKRGLTVEESQQHVSKKLTSKYKGVYYNTHAKRFQGLFYDAGKKISLGYFDSDEDAARAYDRAARAAGKTDKLNFTEDGQPNPYVKVRCSKYRGVIVRSNSYRVEVKKNGLSLCIGTFTDEEEAARAYDKAALKLHGEKAILNFTYDDPEWYKKPIRSIRASTGANANNGTANAGQVVGAGTTTEEGEGLVEGDALGQANTTALAAVARKRGRPPTEEGGAKRGRKPAAEKQAAATEEALRQAQEIEELKKQLALMKESMTKLQQDNDALRVANEGFTTHQIGF